MIALEGLRVLDVTANVAGPYASRILSDLGADVLKIERTGTGDDTRGWGPPFPGGQGLTFLDLNRGKRSVELDFHTDDGAAWLRELVSGADVFIQNLRPGSLDNHGFGSTALTEAHPRLIYAEITGFGDKGPRSRDAAFDPLLQAFSGLMSITGEEGGRPVRIPVSILDKGAGMWAALGVLAALIERERTGCGAVVRTSLLETALNWESVHVLSNLLTGEIPQRLGSGTVGVAPYEAFATSDGAVLIAAGNDRLWDRLCTALNSADLAADPRFSTNAERVRHRDALRDAVERFTAPFRQEALVELLKAHGVPAERINTIADALCDPQVAAVGALVAVPLPDGHTATAVRLPVHFGDKNEHTPSQPAPGLGEHGSAGWLPRSAQAVKSWVGSHAR